MTLGRHMNVVAILRSDAAGEAFSGASADINGTQVAVHVGRLLDVQPGIDILKDPDILILDVDPRDGYGEPGGRKAAPRQASENPSQKQKSSMGLGMSALGGEADVIGGKADIALQRSAATRL